MNWRELLRASGLPVAASPDIGSIVLAALIAATAEALGDMQPLVAGLGGVGLTGGTHHLTLLGLVNFAVVAAVLPGLRNVRSDVLKRVWLLSKEHGIEMPFAQRDVRLRTDAYPAPAPQA